MQGGYGFWSPTHNPAAQRAFLEHIDKRREQAARGRASTPAAGTVVFALSVGLFLLAFAVDPGTVSTVIFLAAAIGGAWLGWLVATRRHPGYVLAFSFLVLGIAGLLVASIPTIFVQAGLAEDAVALSEQAQINRIRGITSAAAVAFALVAGVRALWRAPGSVSLTATGPSPIREASTDTEAR